MRVKLPQRDERHLLIPAIVDFVRELLDHGKLTMGHRFAEEGGKNVIVEIAQEVATARHGGRRIEQRPDPVRFVGKVPRVIGQVVIVLFLHLPPELAARPGSQFNLQADFLELLLNQAARLGDGLIVFGKLERDLADDGPFRLGALQEGLGLVQAEGIRRQVLHGIAQPA